jgi:Flp pilus assembly protein TadG
MVEFALAIPFLLVLAMGVIEFGRLMFSYSAVVSAAREAARFGSAVENYQNCAGIQAAGARVGSLAGVHPENVDISYDDGFGGFELACPPGNLKLGSRIIVEIQGVNYTPMVPMLNLPELNLNSIARRTILIGLELK